MGRDRNERWAASARVVWALVPLGLAAVGCASQRPAPYALAPAAASEPAPATTAGPTTSVRRSSLAPSRRTTTTVAQPRASVPAGSATPAGSGTAAAAPPSEQVVPSATTAPRGRVGNPRVTAPAAPVVPGAPGTPPPPPTDAPVVTPRVAGPTPIVPPSFAAPTTPPTTVTAAAPLTLTAPAGRSVPDGPFDVLVSGSPDAELAADPASVCTVAGGRVQPVGAGDCRVRASAPGFAAGEAVVRITRGDPAITWSLPATTSFTYNTLPLDMRAASGAPVRAVSAAGTCKLAGPGALSFAVAGPSGAPALGRCEVTASVDETPGWNAATVTLTTTTTRAPITVTFDVPASAAVPALTVRAVLTQGDRSLDTLASFGVESAGPCSLAGGPALVDPSNRTAALRVIGSAPSTGWCALRLLTDVGGAGGVVQVTSPPCRLVWIGGGTPASPKPACPW